MKNNTLLIIVLIVLLHSFGISQWRQVNSHFGWNITDILRYAAKIYIGTEKGIFVSNDEGLNWVAINNGLENWRITALIASEHGMFAGTDGSGVYFSADSGAHWVAVNSGLTNRYIKSLKCIGTNLYVGTFSRAWRSTNWGASWNSSYSWNTNMQVSDFTTVGEKIFMATSLNGVYSSSDNGRTWAAINNGLKDTSISSLAVQDSTLFAGTLSSKVFRLSNETGQWEKADSGLTNSSVLKLFSNGTYLYAGTQGGGIFYSENKGAHWRFLGLHNSFVQALTVNGSEIIANNFSSLHLSTDGGCIWRNITNRTPYTDVRGFAILLLHSFTATNLGVYTSVDGFACTQANNGLSCLDVRAIVANDNSVFAGTFGGGVFKSTDFGENWFPVNIGLTNTNVLSLSFSGSNILAGTIGGLFLSTNSGISWSLAADLFLSDVSSLFYTFSRTYASTLFGGIYYSTDNGFSWMGIGLGNQNVYSVFAFPTFPGHTIYAGTGNGLYKSNNDGLSWVKENDGLPYVSIYSLAGSSDYYLFAGTSNGVFLKYSIYPWKQISDGLTAVDIHSLAFNDHNILAGTYSGEIWQRYIWDIIPGTSPLADDLPSSLVLEQNYPNPFNPKTTIKYSVPEAGKIVLTIFDTMGKEVAELVNEDKARGTYQVDFDGSSRASGIYFYRIMQGRNSQTKKLILLK